MVLADRGRYVAACIVIARAYIVAGRPDRLPALPSYDAWSDTVRSALVWLGMSDPVESQVSLRGEDPIRLATTAVFEAWEKELGIKPRGFQTAELIEAADAHSADGSPTRPQLREALLDVAKGQGREDRVNPKRLGWWLKKEAKKIRSGLKLTVDATNKTRPRWILQRVP